MENKTVDKAAILAGKFKHKEALEKEIDQINYGLKLCNQYSSGDLIGYVALGKKRDKPTEPKEYEDFMDSLSVSPYVNIINIPILKLEYITLMLIALKRYISEKIIIVQEDIQNIMSNESSALFNNFSKLHNVKEKAGLNGVKESHAPSEYVAQVTIKKKVKEEVSKLKTAIEWNKIYKATSLTATKINRLIDYKIEKLNLEDLQKADTIIVDEGFSEFLKFINLCKTRRRKDN